MDSERWKQLTHAYGNAGDVPDQLRKIYEPSDNESVWSLYDNVLHQGSVYDSTFAVAPHVVAAAKLVGVEHRLPYLCVIASTNDGIDRERIPNDLREAYEDAVESARVMGLEFIAEAQIEVAEVPYVFEMIASTHGLPVLARMLHDFSNDAFYIECSECNSPLCIEVEKEPFEVFAEESAVFLGRRTDAPPTRIVSRKEDVSDSVECLRAPSDGKNAMGWLCALAKQNGHNTFARKIAAMYGEGICPACQQSFSLFDELDRANR